MVVKPYRIPGGGGGWVGRGEWGWRGGVGGEEEGKNRRNGLVFLIRVAKSILNKSETRCVRKHAGWGMFRTVVGSLGYGGEW